MAWHWARLCMGSSSDGHALERGIDARMAPGVDPAQDSVILAGFENRHAAEHMLASLRRGFRKKHRKGHATALVISGNRDGSLKLTQARVLTASGLSTR
ncbi:MAG: hypothetical protein ABW135_04995 [Thermoleophilaceae bacterium]